MLSVLFLFTALLITLVSGIIVDDTSELIVYSNSPSWSGATGSQPSVNIKWPGNSAGSAYGGTWHEASSRGAYVTFIFTGTAVSVFGIVPKVGIDTSIGFTLDGGTETLWNHNREDTAMSGSAEDYMYGVQVFSASGLSPTSHTLVLKGYLISFVFALDYIEYTPADTGTVTTQSQPSASQSTSSTTQQSTLSASLSSSSGSTTFTTGVSNLSGLNSLPGFSTTTAGSDVTNDLPTIPPSDPRIFYASSQPWSVDTSCGLSSMVTSTVGATFSFNFTGPAIWIYTAANQQGGKYEVSINGTSVGVVETAGSACKIEASYHIGSLDNSVHTLRLTSVGSSSASNAKIDFVGLRLASSVDQNTGFLLPEGGTNKAAIAGGVLGGVAVLFLLGFTIYLCLRRQRQQKLLGRGPIIDTITAVNLPANSNSIPLTEKQRLALASSNNASNVGHGPLVYQSHAKPPMPDWANNRSLGGPSDQSSLYYAEAMESQQQILATQPNIETTGSGAVTQQSYVNPPVPHWVDASEGFRGQTSPHSELAISQQQQQRALALSPLPPSFRTRPFSGQRQSQDAHSTYSTPSHIASNEQSQPYTRSTEQGHSSHPPEMSLENQEWTSAPPYVEDVLARPDARNLSENDVDMIVRRLAEVMRAQNAARGGPGLLRERVAPPRELLDQLVEEHLGARENTS